MSKVRFLALDVHVDEVGPHGVRVVLAIDGSGGRLRGDHTFADDPAIQAV